MNTTLDRLKDKIAIVTGASKGIGAGIAKELAQNGAKVVVNYARSKVEADQVVAEIKQAGGEAIALQADVSRPEEVKKLFAETKTAYGKLDILVNNAGIYEFAALEEITPEHFHKMFNLNVLGLLLASKEAAAAFGPQGGSIINIGSVAGKSALPTFSVYAATKAAVDSVTRSIGAELGPKGVRVNAINPGMVETEGTRAADIVDGDFRKVVETQTPLGRIGQPGDIAPAVVFLASDDARWITGETLYISGGYR